MENRLENKKGKPMKRLGLTILSVVGDLCAVGTVIYWIISNIC